MEPNLFKWATSELSQDAFICWLIEWADPKYKSNLLHETACMLIEKLSGIHAGNIRELEIKRQYKSIDILVLINGEKAILIEDKVHAKHHGDQLTRYSIQLEQEYSKENISKIYFKTGDQSNFREASKNGYKIFSRKCFLEVLNKGKENGIKNDIYLDYFTYLDNLEKSVNSYKTLPLHQWKHEPDWNPWKGFYIELQQRLGEGEWKPVPQKDGGFLGFFWCFKRKEFNKVKYECYLQLENCKLCLKLHTLEMERAKEIKDHCRTKLTPKAEEYGLEIVSSSRVGKYMTLAYLKQDFRKKNEYGIINLDETVIELKKMKDLMSELWG